MPRPACEADIPLNTIETLVAKKYFWWPVSDRSER